MEPHKHTEAQHRYGTAKGYNQTIRMVLMNPLMKTESANHTILATNMLLGFAIELYLKAWLLSAGYPPQKVRGFNHRILDIYEEALSCDLPHVARLHELVRSIDGPHRDFTYRYIDGRDEIDIVEWANVIPILDELDKVIDRAVGASAMYGKEPGH